MSLRLNWIFRPQKKTFNIRIIYITNETINIMTMSAQNPH